MTQQPAARPQPPESSDPLDEVYRRLVSIHHALATDLDGGAELQTRTRHRVKELLDYVGGKLDAREAAPTVSDTSPLTPSHTPESRHQAKNGRPAHRSS